MEEFDEDEEEEELPPPAEVTPGLFGKWRSPRFGNNNPERMDNPVWEWLIRSQVNAFRANELLAGPSPFEAGPGWCFDRLGQSSTKLPDEREVLIAGEHEDSYDPELDSWSIRPVQTSGPAPGWIHSHTATLSDDPRSLLIRCGKLQRDDEDTLVENIDEWRLHLGDWRWERLTDRKWKRWELTREDGELNSLWDYEQAAWSKQFPDADEASGGLTQILEELEMPTLEQKLGGPPDLNLFESLYEPPLGFAALSDLEAEYGVKRIRLDGVIVRYVQDSHSIQVTIEGELSQQTLDVIINDLTDKFARLEKAEIDLIVL